MPPDLNQVLQMLVQVLNGGASVAPNTNPYSAGMNRTMTGSIQQGLLPSLLSTWAPGLQSQVPPNLLMADFAEMQRRTQLRSSTTDKFYMSPVLQRMLGSVGVSEGQLRDPGTGQLNFTGNLVSSLYNNTVGKVIEDPFLSRAQITNQTRDIYSGMMFGRRGGRSGFGLTEDEVQSQVSQMFASSQRGDSLLSSGPFGAKEMFQVQRLGAERGLLQGANIDDIQKRTKGLAQVIKAGQAVFQTMDKEGVLDALQEITQGQIPLSDSGSLNRVMFRVASMARAANSSIEIMTRLAAEGASLYKQVGIGGIAGAGQFLESARMTQIMGGNLGGGTGPIISQQAMARAGGQRAVTALFQQRDVGLFGSSAFQNNTFLLREMGGMTDAQLGKIDRDAVTKRFQDGAMTRTDQIQIMRAAADAQGVSFGVIRARMMAERGGVAEKFLEEGDAFGNKMMVLRAHFKSIKGNLSSQMQKVFSPEALRKENLDSARRATLIAGMKGNMTLAQKGVLADRLMATVIGEQSPQGSAAYETFSKFKLTSARDVRNRRRTAVAMEAMEQRRPSGTFFENIFRGMGGDMTAASFMDSVKSALAGPGEITTQEARRRFLAGDTLAAVTSPMSIRDLQAVSATKLLMTSGEHGSRGRELHAIVAGVRGSAGFTRTSGESSIFAAKSMLDVQKDVSLEGITPEMRKVVAKAVDSQGLSIASMEAIAKKRKIKSLQVLKIAGLQNKEAFRRFEAGVSTAFADMQPKFDDEGNAILNSSIYDQLFTGQKYSSEVQGALGRYARGHPQKGDWELIKASPVGDKFKSEKEMKAHITTQLNAARKQQTDMAVFKGELMESRLHSPRFAAKTGQAALGARKQTVESLDASLKELGISVADDFTDKQRAFLASALEHEGLKEFGRYAAQELGYQLSEEEIGLLATRTAKKGGLKIGDVKTGILAGGKNRTLSQLEVMRKAGEFDPNRNDQKKIDLATEANSLLKQLVDSVTKGAADPGDRKSGLIKVHKDEADD